jgi:hypothetical protein
MKIKEFLAWRFAILAAVALILFLLLTSRAGAQDWMKSRPYDLSSWCRPIVVMPHAVPPRVVLPHIEPARITPWGIVPGHLAGGYILPGRLIPGHVEGFPGLRLHDHFYIAPLPGIRPLRPLGLITMPHYGRRHQ